MVHAILELSRPLSYYPWSVCSFRELWEVIGGCSLSQNVWNLGTSLRKFGTFNPRVSGTPIYLPMIHIIIWWPSGSVIRCHSSPQNRLWSFMYILKKFWYIQSLGYQDPYFRFCGPFVPLGTLVQWLEVVSCPQNKLWNSRYIFKKIWYIKSSGY